MVLLENVRVNVVNSTPSTLLIPRRLQVKLKRALRKRNVGLNVFLHVLLERHQHLVEQREFGKTGKVKTLYQMNGQDLVRVRFRPNDGDWAKLGVLACGVGYSRCLLFIKFLERELAGEKGVTTKIRTFAKKKLKTIVLTVQIHLSQTKNTYKRLFTVRE